MLLTGNADRVIDRAVHVGVFLGPTSIIVGRCIKVKLFLT